MNFLRECYKLIQNHLLASLEFSDSPFFIKESSNTISHFHWIKTNCVSLFGRTCSNAELTFFSELNKDKTNNALETRRINIYIRGTNSFWARKSLLFGKDFRGELPYRVFSDDIFILSIISGWWEASLLIERINQDI